MESKGKLFPGPQMVLPLQLQKLLLKNVAVFLESSSPVFIDSTSVTLGVVGK